MAIKLPNGEYAAPWKCPACAFINHDSIHPVYGPFISCHCSECGRSFNDDQLDKASVASLERARTAAESEVDNSL